MEKSIFLSVDIFYMKTYIDTNNKEEEIMKILKWNIDKEKGRFSYHIEKAPVIKEICYTTISGDVVQVKASEVRKNKKYQTQFGRVIPLNLK